MNVHINTALTNFALGYGSQLGKFVADKIAPVIPVMKQSDDYYITGLEHTDDHSDRIRRPKGGEYARVQHDYTSTSFKCVDVGLEEVIDKVDINNADTGLNPKEDAIRIIREQMDLSKERRLATAIAAASLSSTLDTALSGGNRWDLDTSDPFTNIETLISAVEDNTGVTPNTLFVNKAVFNALKVHADILDRIKYGGTNVAPGKVTPAMIATLFDLDQVIVAKPVYNSAKPGANRVMTSIWPKSAIAMYVPSSIYFGVPTFCAQFSWRGDTGGQDLIVEEYEENRSRGEVVRLRQNRDEKVVGTLFAARYTTVVS